MLLSTIFSRSRAYVHRKTRFARFLRRSRRRRPLWPCEALEDRLMLSATFSTDDGTYDGTTDGSYEEPIDDGSYEGTTEDGSYEDPIDDGYEDPIDDGYEDPIDDGYEDPIVEDPIDDGSGDPTAEEPPEYALDHILVQFEPDALAGEGLSVGMLDVKLGDAVSLETHVYEVYFDEGMTVEEAVEYYSQLDGVVHAQPDYIVSIDLLPNDPLFPNMWGLHNEGQTGGFGDVDIDAAEAWDISDGNNRIVVGVIDTGIDWTHPDLAANIWVNEDEIAGNGIDDDGNGFIDDVRGWDFVNNDNDPMDDSFSGHGTHVAGTVGAVGNNHIGVAGVIHNVNLMPLKFLNAFGFGTIADAIRAIDYATENGAHITNNSWGLFGFPDPLLEAAIRRAQNAGSIFVAAAGNSAFDNDTFFRVPPTDPLYRFSAYPASFSHDSFGLDNVVTVAWIDHFNLMSFFSFTGSFFSDYGATTVDLAAPGEEIWSTFPGGFYGTLSGTSMASPHVAGSLALLWDTNPTWTWQQVVNQILNSADPYPFTDPFTGLPFVKHGRLNVHEAMKGSPADVDGPFVKTAVWTGPTAQSIDNVQITFNEPVLQFPPPPTWTSQGPGPVRGGQVRVPPSNEVAGAIHTVVAHPTNPDILFVGAVNGGIWRTFNATSSSPDWQPLIDDFPSLSIGALEFDPTDPTSQTLIAGFGRFSSLGFGAGSVGGDRAGLLLSTDSGGSWKQITDPLLVGENISGVAARGFTLLAASNNFNGSGGLFRSLDGGAIWTAVSGTGGLPLGDVFDLVGDPGDPDRFYAAVRGAGVFRSDDAGQNWTDITSGVAAFSDIATANVELAIHDSVAGNAVFVGVVNNPFPNARLAGVFRSTDMGATWTAMDTPAVHPGGQGTLHFSIAADPIDPNIVYIGGDRINTPPFSGNLVQGDASLAAGSQFVSIVDVGANDTAPHADSREIVFDAVGNLIQVDDGGIYALVDPSSIGRFWTSLNGDLQVMEFHDIAYDTMSNIIIGGAQDNGTNQQMVSSGTVWEQLSGGDGGDVAVDDVTLAAADQSVRYLSSQFLGGFHRRVFDANNNPVGPPVPIDTTIVVDRQFVTPIELNTIDPRRMIIGGASTVYESLDITATAPEINAISMGIGVNSTFNGEPIAYGGRRLGVDNADVLYVGFGDEVFVRTIAGGSLTPTSPLPFGVSTENTIRDIVLDPEDWMTAFVVDADQVFHTTDAGLTWTDITDDLSDINSDFRTIVYVPGLIDAILLGGGSGVSRLLLDSGATWAEFGVGLPNAPVWDMDYDAVDDVLVVGTLGRGTWTVPGNIATDFTADTVSLTGPSGSIPVLSLTEVPGSNATQFDIAFPEQTELGTYTLTVGPNIADLQGNLKDQNMNGTGGEPGVAPDGDQFQSFFEIKDTRRYTVTGNFPIRDLEFTFVPLDVGDFDLTIADLDVKVDITHTWVSDLYIWVMDPFGTATRLFTRRGGSGDDVLATFNDEAQLAISQGQAPFDGEFKPEQFLSSFDGMPALGTWQLIVFDAVAGDQGAVQSYTLIIEPADGGGGGMMGMSLGAIGETGGSVGGVGSSPASSGGEAAGVFLPPSTFTVTIALPATPRFVVGDLSPQQPTSRQLRTPVPPIGSADDVEDDPAERDEDWYEPLLDLDRLFAEVAAERPVELKTAAAEESADPEFGWLFE